MSGQELIPILQSTSKSSIESRLSGLSQKALRAFFFSVCAHPQVSASMWSYVTVCKGQSLQFMNIHVHWVHTESGQSASMVTALDE